MYIFADCHIGANRRNKFHHRKGFEAWKSMVLDAVEKANGKESIVFAGDLWDSDRPTPQDLVLVKETLEEGISNLPDKIVSYVIIPGNHDRVTVDGYCAADILHDNLNEDSNNYTIFTTSEEWHNRYDDECWYYFIPYSADILEELKKVSNSVGFNKRSGKAVLISHFTTKEMNPFAGIISEDDPVFDPFDVVILGDCHIAYDNGKFHTTGSTYMFNVDEMYSKKCVPGYIHIDDNTGEVTRFSYKGLKPVIIDSEDEAIDDEQLYLIVTSEVINVSKPNVFVKYRPKTTTDEDNGTEITESVEIRSINKDKVFEIMYPELDDSERRILKMYANGEIDIEDVITGKMIQVHDNTGSQISEIELQAELDGLLSDDNFDV